MKTRHAVTALVLAGGQGTRIKALYPDLPKPLIPAAEAPFLEWVTRWLAGQGIGHLVYSTGYLADQIHQWAEDLSTKTTLRLVCRAEEAPLGTGGAVRHCLDLCQETVLVVNGDSLTLTDLDRAFSRLKDENLDGVLVGIPVQDTSRYGALDVNEQGLLQGFREKQPGSGMINCGIYLFRRRLLETIPLGQSLSLETDVIPHALSKGAQIAVVHPARTVGEATFLDIGTPQTVHQASAFIARTPDAFPALPAPLH